MHTKTLYRLASLFVLISLVISTNLVAHASTSAAPVLDTTNLTFGPVADAYVIQSSPDTNYGASTSLRVDNTPLTRSYLRYVVGGLNGGAVQSAKLRIYANSSNTVGYSVFAVADNTWAEDTITYNNSPAAGNNLSNSQPFSGGVWTEVDISGYIQAEGTYNLVITTTSDTNTNLASRESGVNAPQLVVTSVSQATSTPASLPTSTTVPTLVPTSPPTATNVPTLVPTNIPTSTNVPAPTATSPAVTDWQPSFPIRAAFYYPWFPQAWTQSGIYPYTNYTPSLGYYSSADQTIIKKHIDMMQYGNIQAGISSWWGQGHYTDTNFAGLLSAAAGTNFRWSLYYENESLGDPSVNQIQSDLTYIRDHYGNDPSFLRVGGKFVVFVYSDAVDACGMADRWKQANTVGAYVVLKVFPGYASCANQPDSWHQYSPAVAADQQGTISYAISPGFWLKGQTVRLTRDLARWTQNVKDMVASGAKWQLVTTFSEWGEGTIVEPAAEWASASGYGQYLDALHFNGNTTAPTQTSVPQATATQTSLPLPTATQTSASLPTSTNTPAPTATKVNTPTSIPGQSQNLTFTPAADAYVNASSASTNYGGLTSLRVDASPVVKSYLRFSVQGLGGQAISQARLLIYANSGSTQGLVAQSVANNTWGEMTMNSSNAPALGSTLASSPAVASGTWVTLDVTSYVIAEGTFNFGVTTPGNTAISLASRESGANSPKLIVSINGSSTPGATSVPSSVPTATKTSAPVFTPTSTPVPVFTATSTLLPPTATLVGPTATNTPVSSYTPVILTKGPTLIFTGDNTKMRIFWQWSSNATFQMQWGTTTSYELGNVAVNPTDTTNHLYTYDVSSLTPGAKYYYRAVVGSQYSSGTFYTAPASNATNLNFISYGDTRTNGSVHNGLAGQVVSLYQSDPAFQTFNLQVGDWVSGDSEGAWNSEWFAPSYTSLRTQDANIADIGVRGNHEGGATYWKRYWPEPFNSGGLYWSFDYGPAHIVMLDQYTAYGAGSAQYNWLKADLAASSKTWKFVVLHEPGWSAGGGHANNTTVQNDIQPLLVQYGVSIVFGGHNHYYARANVNGVVHLTMGGGGAPQYTPATGQPNIVTTSASYSFGEFTISGNTLTAKVVNNSGATIDTFTVTR